MKPHALLSSIAIILAAVKVAFGQVPGALDTSFSVGSGADNWVWSTALQADGKIVVAGTFLKIANADSTGVARLNPDGSFDGSFKTPFRTNNWVNSWIQSAIIQPDGKIVLSGSFPTDDGLHYQTIIRLTSDGGVDSAFNSGLALIQGTGSTVGNAVVIQPDGKLIIGGFLSLKPGDEIARLNSDGSVDPAFKCSVSPDWIRAVALQDDGKVIIGGSFTNVNGQLQQVVARLNSDGSLDNTFSHRIVKRGPPYVDVLCVTTQSDGKVLVGGDFANVGGAARRGVARLNPDGSLDTTFTASLVGSTVQVRSIVLQPDGKILVGGYFGSNNGPSFLIRLNPNGSLDTTFKLTPGPNLTVTAISTQTDGKIIIGGVFNTVNGISSRGIARLYGTPLSPPSITVQPSSQTVSPCSDVTFAVVVSGTPPLSYQWQFNGANIAGATNSSLLLPGVKPGQVGDYQVVVSNAVGVATSSPAKLTLDLSGGGTIEYTFTTLAGSAGNPGSADGTGSAARFNSLIGVAVDSAGNVYVADQSNSTIRKVTPAGVVTTLAGLAGSNGSADGTGSAARFNYPLDVVVDSAGNVYVADSDNGTIRKVTPAGEVTTLAGLAGSFGSADGTGSAARFNAPTGVAVDSTGNVYVTDELNHIIRKVTPSGEVTTLAGLAGSFGSADGTGSAARFQQPNGVAVDNVGNVYVTDEVNHTIRKVTPAGVVTTLAGLAGSNGSADGTGSAARFLFPRGVAVDSADNVYVADTFNSTIRKVTPAGVVTTLAGLTRAVGNADGTGSAARFNYPNGVAVDNAGNVYVADSDNSTIRKGVPSVAAPTITFQPQNQTNNVGANVTFTVVATGSLPLTYQWRFNDADIIGATDTALNLSNLQLAQAGNYNVVVSGCAGTAISQPARLTVLAPNTPPSVVITSPLNGAAFIAPTNITITATVTDTDGTVAKVEFFQATTKLGEAASVPFNFIWSNVSAGNYTLTAKATDNLGASSTSASVLVTVTNQPVNLPPVVAITSPKDGDVFAAGSDVAITATASDADGTVARVEFFAGTVLLGSATASPFSVTWKNVATGDYVLTAKATDNGGFTVTSVPVRVSVADLTGDVAIVRAVDDAEVAQLKADVVEMGLVPVLFARDTVSASVLQNYRLVIFDDQGDATRKLTATEVDALADTFAAGVPVLCVGENLASADLNLDAGHQARWSALTRMQRASGKLSVTSIDVPDSQDLHPFYNGAWGKPAGFAYAGQLDNARVTAGDNAEALLSSAQAQLFIVSPPLSAVDDGSTRVVTQNFLLTGRGDDAADFSRKQLFQNTVCWLLRICPTCSAGHAANLLVTTLLSSTSAKVGDVVTNTITLALNGECAGNGVAVTNQLPANLRFVSAATPQGTWRESGGVVAFFLGDVERGGRVELTVVVAAVAPGTVDIQSCGRMNRLNFTAADHCAAATITITGSVAPRLSIEARVGTPRVRLSGTPGAQYAIEVSGNPVDKNSWKEITRVTLGAELVDVTDSAAAGAKARFYRARAIP
ncbi:MAG: immunoglobulin domain-containing protein [Verrucomicrobia bacterium]|nr:immunoglobulin domain-containing protein [Verrucomicrobiota bacterium]